MSGSRLEQRFGQCFGVDAFGRMQAQRVMEPYRRAREHLLTTTSSSSSTATTATSGDPVRDLPCWSFYRNRLSAAPRDETLKELLRLGGLQLHDGQEAVSSSSLGIVGYRVTKTKEWAPSELEYRHDYIQWLFPLRETGVNPYAALLTDRDVRHLCTDGAAMANVLCAFYVMLRFYGMHMTLAPASGRFAMPQTRTKTKKSKPGDHAARSYTATFSRSTEQDEYRSQYTNLRRHGHNFLRISRILQFLGEVGLEPLKVGWLRFLAREILVPPLTHSRSAATESHVATTRPRSMETDSTDDDGETTGEEEEEMRTSPVPPLAPCESSFATFWIETPYDADVRLELKAEALTLLDQVDAAVETRDSDAKAKLAWASAANGRGPVVCTAPFVLPADTPVRGLPFFREEAEPAVRQATPSPVKSQKRPRERP